MYNYEIRITLDKTANEDALKSGRYLINLLIIVSRIHLLQWRKKQWKMHSLTNERSMQNF